MREKWSGKRHHQSSQSHGAHRVRNCCIVVTPISEWIVEIAGFVFVEYKLIADFASQKEAMDFQVLWRVTTELNAMPYFWWEGRRRMLRAALEPCQGLLVTNECTAISLKKSR